MRLVKSFRFLGSNREKVHWASRCGRFTARKEFWSQCKVLLLFNAFSSALQGPVGRFFAADAEGTYSMYDVFSLRYLVTLRGQQLMENITC